MQQSRNKRGIQQNIMQNETKERKRDANRTRDTTHNMTQQAESVCKKGNFIFLIPN